MGGGIGHSGLWWPIRCRSMTSALAVERRKASRTSTPARSCASWRLIPFPLLNLGCVVTNANAIAGPAAATVYQEVASG